MTHHNHSGYHAADWTAADRVGARIRLGGFWLIGLGVVTLGLVVRAFM